jgi:hypothetical protein
MAVDACPWGGVSRKRARISADTHPTVRTDVGHRVVGVVSLGEACGPVPIVGDSDDGYTQRKLIAERFYASSRHA